MKGPSMPPDSLSELPGKVTDFREAVRRFAELPELKSRSSAERARMAKTLIAAAANLSDTDLAVVHGFVDVYVRELELERRRR